MKRLLFIASLAILAASCQKTTINAVVEMPIGFSSEVGKQTRAIVSDTKYLTDQPFAVYAYGHQLIDDVDVPNQRPIMDNIEMIRTKEGNPNANPVTYDEWSTGGIKYYWPNDPRTHINFYAYSPSQAENASAEENHQLLTGEISHDETNGLTLTDYVHSNMYVDFMVGRPVIKATFADQDGKGGSAQNLKSVPMSFNHEMTQVIFKVKTNAEYSDVHFIVNSITLNNVGNKSTYTHAGMTPNYEDAILNKDTENEVIKFARGTWSNPSTKNENGYTVFPAVAITANTLDGAPGLENNQTAQEIGNTQEKTLATIPVTMIPQTLGDITFNADNTVESGTGQYFTIDYNISGTGVAAENVVKRVALKTGNHTAWKQNARVTYTISIGLNEITFTPSVMGWDDEEAGYEIIQ